MSKEQFLKELSSHLRKLPDEERKDILFEIC
ncbi:Predicted membrane protein [Streptococcus pneumoniae]|nr:Predicted membrane protein [Streptococcus pneumoniae]